MDVLLVSQLEALFVNDFFTLISSSWTWLAVLTAALSFWRFKTVAPHSPPTKSTTSPLLHHQQTREDAQEPIQSVPLACDLCNLKPRIAEGEVDGITKRKFTVYLENHANDGDDDGVLAVAHHDEEINRFNVVCGWESRDIMFVRRSRDLGCYRYQDLKAFNGSVVKLWEGKRRGYSQLEIVQW